jgi:hypothetical protein
MQLTAIFEPEGAAARALAKWTPASWLVVLEYWCLGMARLQTRLYGPADNGVYRLTSARFKEEMLLWISTGFCTGSCVGWVDWGLPTFSSLLTF